jgi:hypothetical protein
MSPAHHHYVVDSLAIPSSNSEASDLRVVRAVETVTETMVQ